MWGDILEEEHPETNKEVISPTFDFTIFRWPRLRARLPWKSTFPGDYYTDSSDTEIETLHLVRPFGRPKKLKRPLTSTEIKRLLCRKPIIWNEVEKYLLDGSRQHPYAITLEEKLAQQERMLKLDILQRKRFKTLDILPDNNKSCCCCCCCIGRNGFRRSNKLKRLKKAIQKLTMKPRFCCCCCKKKKEFSHPEKRKRRRMVTLLKSLQDMRNANAKVLNINQYFRKKIKFSTVEHYQSDNEIYHHAMCYINRTHPMWMENNESRMRRRRDERILRRLARLQFWNSFRNRGILHWCLLVVIWIGIIWSLLKTDEIMKIVYDIPYEKERMLANISKLRKKV